MAPIAVPQISINVAAMALVAVPGLTINVAVVMCSTRASACRTCQSASNRGADRERRARRLTWVRRVRCLAGRPYSDEQIANKLA